MELYHYIIIAVVAVIALVLVIYLVKRTKVEKKDFELPSILALLDKKNIQDIDFVRNKIVLNFKDVSKFDTNQLHVKGAKGISIVGDKVKFYFDGDSELNKKLYNQIKKHIEG